MNFPCPAKINCPPQGNLDYDFPIANLTSEKADHEIFIGIAWGPLDAGGSQPPLGSLWTARGCAFVCQSIISQEDANLCAQQQAALCTWGTWTPGHPPPGPGGLGGNPQQIIYTNGLAQCPAGCPDGSTFTWTILPGTYFALTQALADEIAQSVACQKALQFFFCIGDFTNTATTGTPYSSINNVTGNNHGPFSAQIIAGALPDGLRFFNQGGGFLVVSGTPTKAGTFNFTLQVTDAAGNFMSKAFTITVKSSCTDFWNSVVGNWTFQTISPNSVASLVQNVVTVSAYTRNGLDLSGIAEADNGLFVGNPTQVAQFQCQLTVVPLAITNIGPVGQLTITVDDFSSPATYLSFTGLPGAPIVLNFTIPIGARPRVGIQAAVQTPNNGFDSQVAYAVSLG